MRVLRKYDILYNDEIPRFSIVIGHLTIVKPKVLIVTTRTVCRFKSRMLYDFTRVTRVCINKAPFRARSSGVYELPDVQL